jgi:rare lipoprotein A
MGEGVGRGTLLAAVVLVLGACGGPASVVTTGHGLRPHPTYKIGAAYAVKGVTYYPHVDYAYDQVGTASWYGEQFQGRYTANGEVFDLNEITAAHTTLPLPSVVEVVNLQNGRALRIRVNDRGPFVQGRIIDLSRRAAQLLGFEGAGTTSVRVRVLKDDSIGAAAAAERGLISNGEAPLTDIASTVPATIQAAAPARRFFVASPRYHVEAGPVATEKDADRLRERMIDSGYRDAQIVID